MVLAAAPRLDRLTTLSLHQCNVSNAGIAALAASPQLVRLRVLRLAGSLITDEVVDTWSLRPPSPACAIWICRTACLSRPTGQSACGHASVGDCGCDEEPGASGSTLCLVRKLLLHRASVRHAVPANCPARRNGQRRQTRSFFGGLPRSFASISHRAADRRQVSSGSLECGPRDRAE